MRGTSRQHHPREGFLEGPGSALGLPRRTLLRPSAKFGCLIGQSERHERLVSAGRTASHCRLSIDPSINNDTVFVDAQRNELGLQIGQQLSELSGV
jgi:hypothetical protein